MINPFKDINWRPDIGELRKFGITLMIGAVIVLFILIGVHFMFENARGFTRFWSKAFLVVMIAGFLVLALPRIFKPIYHIWFFLGACMGIVISNTIMLVFYYVFFTGTALILRLTGRDVLRLKRPQSDSMWLEHKQPKDVSRYYRKY